MNQHDVLSAWTAYLLIGLISMAMLKLFDGDPSPHALTGEPLPFHYASTTLLNNRVVSVHGRDRFEATGSLPARPRAMLVEWDDDLPSPRDDLEATEPLISLLDTTTFMAP